MPNIHVLMYEQKPIILVDKGEHRGYYIGRLGGCAIRGTTWRDKEVLMDAHGKESVTTQLESESASALCTKKSTRSCSQL